MEIEFYPTRPTYGEAPKLNVHEREYPGMEARLALALIERWGMVVAATDGEDSAGRAKIKAMDPSDMVSRAFETARITMLEIRARNLMIQLPSYEEMEEAAKARGDKN